uniref:BZIP domain-containing protein n=1 Tax=Peronospora matthiolae TaxID=2874970 RepID=A0AAV1TI61_9STRA
MHCHHASSFDSSPALDPYPRSCNMRVSQLETSDSFRRPVAGLQFHLGGRSPQALWNGRKREVSSSRSPFIRSQQQMQNLFLEQVRDDQDGDDDHRIQDSGAATVVKQSKTNSERGRAFRARRRKYENELVTIVNSLRQKVTDLGFLRSARADGALRSRNSLDGSLVRLAQEYFALFERGVPSVRRVGQKRPGICAGDSYLDGIVSCESFVRKQKAFLESAMDPELQFGGAVGLDVLLDQWEKYTSYHSSLYVEVVSVQVSGGEENPIVTLRSKLHVVLSRATFDHVFPHVADNEDLVRRFIGKKVVYHGVNHFHFSPKGQISIYDSDVGFVDALVHAGASISDIALLMQHARIADEYRLKDDDENSSQMQEYEQENRDDASDCATDVDSRDDAFSRSNDNSYSPNAERTSFPDRFAIDFILS